MKTNKDHGKHQFCACCNKYVKISLTYPNYACSRCVSIATDEEGNSIAFYTITNDGNGMQAVLTDSNKLVRTTTCFIKEIKFEAQKGEVGGIVLIPAEEDKPKKKRKSKGEKIDIPK